MTDKYDFKTALEEVLQMEEVFSRLAQKETWPAIQTALRLADRLQSGEVSVGMVDACMSVYCPEKTHRGRKKKYFKAMAAQMIKETQND